MFSIMFLNSKLFGILKKSNFYFGLLGVIIIILLIVIIERLDGNENENKTKDCTSIKNQTIEDVCTAVTLPSGKLQGRKVTSRTMEFFAFQEIPYAKPPIGDLRFRDPIPVEKWDGVLNVTRNTKTCFQYVNFLHVRNWTAPQTEDCLYLNVYTPVCPKSRGSLNVMFFIYGSGYLSEASDYDLFGPDHLMENDIIVVTFNHRLGPLGFISTGDTVIPGNYGMKDQVLALKWVNKNIQYFGGDPRKVTIVGQSSGGSSVALHLMSKLSEGLYSSAVCMSGTSINSWAYQKNHRRLAFGLAELLDGNFKHSASSEELLEFLRGVPADKLNAVVHNFPKTFLDSIDIQGFVFTPVIEPEHEDAFITDNMYSAMKEGRMNKVPLLIGIVSEEAINKFDIDTQSLTLPEVIQLWKQSAREIDENPANMVLDNMNIINETEKNRVGNIIHNIYTKKTFSDDLGILVKYYSQTTFDKAIIRHAELQSNFSDVYFYRFSYYSPTLNGMKPDFEGAYKVGHGDDNVFIWLFNGVNIYDQAIPKDILTSCRYRALITNFMKYSNPTPNESPLFNNITWPKVHPDSFQFVDINDTITVQNDIRDATYLKFVEIYETLAQKPLLTF